MSTYSITTNGADQLVQNDGSGNLPALSAVNLTNLPGANITPGTVELAALDAGGTPSATTFLRGDGTWSTAVTSVGLSAPSVFSVSGSPVTEAGTLALDFAGGQAANQVLATPDGTAGPVGLRGLVVADLPSTVTTQGNTFNGANELVQTDGSGSLPAISGANLTNLPGGSLASNSVTNAALAQMPANTIKGNITGATANASDIAFPYTGYKNILIGGDFSTNPWQRGTSFTNVPITDYLYTADRWAIGTGAGSGVTISKQGSIGLTGFSNSLRCQRPAGTSNPLDLAVYQIVESANTIPLQGQVITLSFWARKGSDFSSGSSLLSVGIETGTGIDEGSLVLFTSGWSGAVSQGANVTLATTWIKFTFQITVSTSATELFVGFSYVPMGTAGAADYFEIAGVQLEANPYATAFELRPAGLELSLCQRYFFKTFAQGTTPTQNVGTHTGEHWFAQSAGASSAAAGASLPFPATMRTTPAVTGYNPSASNNLVRNETSGSDWSAVTYGGSDRVITIQGTTPAGTSAGNACGIHFTADAEL